VGPGNQVLDGAQTPRGKGQFFLGGGMGDHCKV